MKSLTLSVTPRGKLSEKVAVLRPLASQYGEMIGINRNELAV